MGRTDKDLRHRHSAMGAFDHDSTQLRAAADVDLGKSHSFALKQGLGADAIRTIACRINFHRRHDRPDGLVRVLYMGVRTESTTRANTSTSTLAAPARNSERA